MKGDKKQIFTVISSIANPAFSTSAKKQLKPNSSGLSGVKQDAQTMYKWALKNNIKYSGGC